MRRTGTWASTSLDDEYLLQINCDFYNTINYTDIITFDLFDSDQRDFDEIHISLDWVKDNAATHGVTFTEELHRVIFHGALHFCGTGIRNSPR